MARGRQIRAGRAYVELGVEDKLTRGLRAAQRRLQSFGQQVRRIGTRLTGLGAAITAPLVAATRQFSRMGDRLDKMAARTGFSVEALSELGFAAEQSGSDVATLESGIRGFQQVLRNAERGLSRAKDNLEGVGLAYETLRDLSPEEQFIAVAEALSRIEDPTRRAGLAMQLLGGAGQQLLPLLSQGAEGIEALRDQARELGLTISTEAAAEAAKFTDRMNILRRVLQRATFTIGSALAPVVGDLVERFTDAVVKASAWIKANRQLVVWVAKVGAIITAAGVALIGLGAALSLAGVAIGGMAAIVAGVVKGFVLLKAAVAALVTPIRLVIVAAGALGAYLIHATDAGGKALAWLGERFEQLRDVATRAFRGIGDAMAAGDIALAGRILWLTLRKQWLKGTKWLQDRWTDFKHEFLRLSADAWFGSVRLLARALFHIERAWANTRSFFANLWNDVRGDATETWNAVVYLGRRAAAHTKAAFDETMDLDARLREIDQQFLDAQHGEQRRRRQQEREIARERDRRIQQAERDLEGTLDVLLQQHADRLSDIDQAHERELDDTARAIEDARREWQKAIEDARRARESVGDDVDAPDGFRGPREFLKDFEGIIGNLRDVAERTIQVRGTFSPVAAHAIGVAGDAEQRTARATEDTARNTKRLLDEARDGGLAFG